MIQRCVLFGRDLWESDVGQSLRRRRFTGDNRDLLTQANYGHHAAASRSHSFMGEVQVAERRRLRRIAQDRGQSPLLELTKSDLKNARNVRDPCSIRSGGHSHMPLRSRSDGRRFGYPELRDYQH